MPQFVTTEPSPGHFILHDAAVPDLPAGDYVLDVEHQIDVPGESSDPIPAKETHLEITAPRYVMPPDQILSTFPPNQAEGAFETRLPQIVLRRRTLPWERPHQRETKDVPWLALVLIADGEGEMRPNTPVSQCVSLGRHLYGDSDAETGTALRVTDTVVQQVFPGRDEVKLLTHVRRVDLSDTELALGDDDGWMAVVVANRLPQPGVRYRACLISLEGQLDLLPNGADANTAPDLQQAYVYPELARELKAGRVTAALALACKDSEVSFHPQRPGKATGHTISDAWSNEFTSSPNLGGLGSLEYAQLPPLQLAGIELEHLHPQEMESIPVFPVLAHWTFTCSEKGDFQYRMQNLHVGLLGTAAPPAEQKPGKAPPPRSRPDPEIAATGHLVLDAVTREGESERVWYRGPLSPRPGTRNQADENGVVPLLHVADQARRIGPDGQEDVALAVAFEIGRLLALAEPAVVAALMRWRRNGFQVQRTTRLLQRDRIVQPLLQDGILDLPIRLGLDLLVDLGRDSGGRIGPSLPLIDPGHPFMDFGNVIETITRGFGLPGIQHDGEIPEAPLETDLVELLNEGAAGMPHLSNAMELERERVFRFIEKLDEGGRP